MGCCVLVLVGAVWPRLVLVLIYVFMGHIPAAVFETWVWPLLGFFFLPTTTLAYALGKWYVGPVDSPMVLVLLGLAFLHDLGQLGAVGRRRREQVVVRGRGE